MIARYAASALGMVVATATVLRLAVFSPFLMSGSSMEPTILPGEYILATRGGSNSIHRDDIAILECQKPERHVCLKRVIALEGDRLDFTEGLVRVNGQLRHELIVPDGKDSLVVPPETFYVVNDSAADGEDSRVWGPIDAGTTRGRARIIWLSLDWFDENGGVRDFPKLRANRIFRLIR